MEDKLSSDLIAILPFLEKAASSNNKELQAASDQTYAVFDKYAEELPDEKPSVATTLQKLKQRWK